MLEVLTGAPDLEDLTLSTGFVENGQVLPFTLATPVPLGKWVAEVQIFAELLADAQVATEPLTAAPGRVVRRRPLTRASKAPGR